MAYLDSGIFNFFNNGGDFTSEDGVKILMDATASAIANAIAVHDNISDVFRELVKKEDFSKDIREKIHSAFVLMGEFLSMV